MLSDIYSLREVNLVHPTLTNVRHSHTYCIGIIGHKEGQVTDSFLNYFHSA